MKLPYLYVLKHVELLYAKEIPPGDDAVDKHCKFIADFIRACGYSEDEFMLLMHPELQPIYKNLN